MFVDSEAFKVVLKFAGGRGINFYFAGGGYFHVRCHFGDRTHLKEKLLSPLSREVLCFFLLCRNFDSEGIGNWFHRSFISA